MESQQNSTLSSLSQYSFINEFGISIMGNHYRQLIVPRAQRTDIDRILINSISEYCSNIILSYDVFDIEQDWITDRTTIRFHDIESLFSQCAAITRVFDAQNDDRIGNRRFENRKTARTDLGFSFRCLSEMLINPIRGCMRK